MSGGRNEKLLEHYAHMDVKNSAKSRLIMNRAHALSSADPDVGEPTVIRVSSLRSSSSVLSSQQVVAEVGWQLYHEDGDSQILERPRCP